MVKNVVLQCSGCGKEYPFGTYSCDCNTGVLIAEYDFGNINSINELEDPSKPGI